MSLQVARYVEHVMGTPVSLALRGRHTADAAAHDAWRAVTAELRWADGVFSTYREDSWVSRLGRGEVALADSPPQVAEVLALAEQAEVDSGGAFSAHLPSSDGQRRLDPSGVVKGWAVERAAAALSDLPETDQCLSAGGDMTCLTVDPDAAPWHIGVEDPRDPTAVVAVVPVFTGAVATSGTAHRGQHLVDARTGPHQLAGAWTRVHRRWTVVAAGTKESVVRPLRCLMGIHAWPTQRTEDGQDFQRCARCHRDRLDEVRPPVDDAYGRARGFFGGSM